MSGAHRTLQLGPATYEVSEPVTGGQLVEPATGSGNEKKVKPAAAGSTKVLGVATADANTAANQPGQVDASFPQKLVSVGYGPAEYRLMFAAAADFGAPVAAAANGQVTGGGGTPPTGEAIVGICTEPGGVEAGKPGRVRLYI